MMPILYSYRRCPYAMRARMALRYSGVAYEHREIDLRNKPQSLLLASPKGTVPVLCCKDHVLEQSLDIMRWALEKSDPDGWLHVAQNRAQDWLEKNDGLFKILLDQYKYPNRFPELDPNEVFNDACQLMLEPMETALSLHPYLLGDKLSWVDVAIFPFIRQFSMVDSEKFRELPYGQTQKWLAHLIQSDLFNTVMNKYPIWID